MKIEAAVTISRDSADRVSIRIYDRASNIEFAYLRMAPSDFTMAITGQARVDAVGEVKGLEHVGKKRIREQRRIRCPYPVSSSCEMLVKWLQQAGQEDGWMVDSYIGSQGSITSDPKRPGGCIINYSVYRYEEVKE